MSDQDDTIPENKLINSGRIRSFFKSIKALSCMHTDEKLINVITFALIMIAALVLRLFVITAKDIWMDEAMSIYHAQQSIIENLIWFKTETNPPLYALLLNGWVKLFGTSALAVRLPSLLFGMLSVACVYILCRHMFADKKPAFYAMLFMSVNPFHIHYSVEARAYALLCLFAIVSTIFFFKYIENNNIKYAHGYVFSIICLLYIHNFACFVVLVHNLYIISLYTYKREWRKIPGWILMQLIISIFYLPYFFLLLQHIKMINGNFWIPIPDIKTVYETICQLTGSDVGLIMAAACFLISVIKKKNNTGSFFIYWWFILPIVVVYIYSQFSQSIFLNRYFIICQPALMIIMAYCLYRITTNKILQYILAAVFAILLLFQVNINRELNQVYYEPWQSFAAEIKTKGSRNDVIIIEPDAHAYAFSYYYIPDFFKTTNDIYDGLENYNIYCFKNREKEFNESFKKLLRDKPVWLILGAEQVSNEQNIIYRHLVENKKEVYRKYFINPKWINLIYFKPKLNF